MEDVYSEEDCQKILICYTKCGGRLRKTKQLCATKYKIYPTKEMIKFLVRNTEIKEGASKCYGSLQKEIGAPSNGMSEIDIKKEPVDEEYEPNNKEKENQLEQIPIVYTAKLEDMFIFRKDFHLLEAKDIIDNITLESKPMLIDMSNDGPQFGNLDNRFHKMLSKLQHLNSKANIIVPIENNSQRCDGSEKIRQLLLKCRDVRIVLEDCNLKNENTVRYFPRSVKLDAYQGKTKINQLCQPSQANSSNSQLRKFRKKPKQGQYECVVFNNLNTCTTDLYYINKSTHAVIHSSLKYLLDKNQMPPDTLFISNCCWYSRQNNIGSLTNSTDEQVRSYITSKFFKMKHDCPLGKCICCCKNKYDSQHWTNNMINQYRLNDNMSNVTNIKEEPLGISSRVGNTDCFIDRALRYKIPKNKEHMPHIEASINISHEIQFVNHKTGKVEIYRLTMDNLIDSYTEIPITDSLTSNCLTSEKCNACCWVMRDIFIKSLLHLPTPTQSYMRKPHPCIPEQCTCCCRDKYYLKTPRVETLNNIRYTKNPAQSRNHFLQKTKRKVTMVKKIEEIVPDICIVSDIDQNNGVARRQNAFLRPLMVSSPTTMNTISKIQLSTIQHTSSLPKKVLCDTKSPGNNMATNPKIRSTPNMGTLPPMGEHGTDISSLPTICNVQSLSTIPATSAVPGATLTNSASLIDNLTTGLAANIASIASNVPDMATLPTISNVHSLSSLPTTDNAPWAMVPNTLTAANMVTAPIVNNAPNMETIPKISNVQSLSTLPTITNLTGINTPNMSTPTVMENVNILSNPENNNMMVNQIVGTILQTFKDVKLRMSPDGEISAEVKTPLDKLSIDELKILSAILSHAKEQVKLLRPSTPRINNELNSSNSFIGPSTSNVSPFINPTTNHTLPNTTSNVQEPNQMLTNKLLPSMPDLQVINTSPSSISPPIGSLPSNNFIVVNPLTTKESDITNNMSNSVFDAYTRLCGRKSKLYVESYNYILRKKPGSEHVLRADRSVSRITRIENIPKENECLPIIENVFSLSSISTSPPPLVRRHVQSGKRTMTNENNDKKRRRAKPVKPKVPEEIPEKNNEFMTPEPELSTVKIEAIDSIPVVNEVIPITSTHVLEPNPVKMEPLDTNPAVSEVTPTTKIHDPGSSSVKMETIDTTSAVNEVSPIICTNEPGPSSVKIETIDSIPLVNEVIPMTYGVIHVTSNESQGNGECILGV